MSYSLKQLRNGTWTIHSETENECFHPGMGPVAEARALYVEQQKLVKRLRVAEQEMVIWDVGLGSGANVLTFLRDVEMVEGEVRIESFDQTLEPLGFASSEGAKLGFVNGYEDAVQRLLKEGDVCFKNGQCKVRWKVHVGDFPNLLKSDHSLPSPDAILFDAFSPKKNPFMWTLPLFRRLKDACCDERPCSISTYSRSTMIRVSWLMAGFYVGAGRATGVQEETTVASTSLQLLNEPLGADWLERVKISDNAEPLIEPVYEQKGIQASSWEALLNHPQFTSR